MLVARIIPFLTNLISPIQTTFVPGRRGVDNVVIAQDLIYTMDKMKGREGYMAVKANLEKAYDRLEWSFIHKVLQAFWFPHNLLKVIMSCISTSSISVLVNGCALDSFNPLRGIRQGDPLSPYLFIICIEYLGYLIEEKCSKGLWFPLKASHGNIKISHLFFADDLILFAKVTNEVCEAILDVLRTFCLESGQKISCAKSIIFFSPNVGADLKEKVCERLGMLETSNFRKYLGFPLKHKGAPRRQFNFVADQVMNKLAGWKANFLSFAGRVVLVKSVMSAIPTYIMQGVTFPIHLCDKLDKINRDFLWGSTNEKCRMLLVGWEKSHKTQGKAWFRDSGSKSKEYSTAG